MKADLSRITFRPRKHYSAVVMQQGRVQIDADWNEQRLIDAHRGERTMTDVVGASGAPLTAPGFGLGFTPDRGDLVIGSGRFYVDGLLCELDAGELLSFTSGGDANATVPLTQPDLVDLAPGQWVAVSVGSATTQLLSIVAAVPGDASLVLTLSAAITRPATPANGDFNGKLQRVVTYLTQPDSPGPAFMKAGGDGGPATLDLANGPYIVYLDAWQRHVDALDDPAIRETALGGPDTAARAQTVCQVRLLRVTYPIDGPAMADTQFDPWDALVDPVQGRLSARSVPPAGQAGPCLIPPGGGYQGLENQLYRVEILDSGPDGRASFVWSRDNGIVVTGIVAFSGAVLTVDSTGPDDALGFANGQLVEIAGDLEDLQGRRGQVLQIATVDIATSTVTFEQTPTPIDASLHPKLRRWDGLGLIPAGGGDWFDLESGVQVAFTSGLYACGDYWLVPARAGAMASVEWDHATPQAPSGIVHHYARLGWLDWQGATAARLLGLDGKAGLHGWQWLLLVEGLPAVVLGLVILRFLPDAPETVRWLSDAEKDWIRRRLAGDAARIGEPVEHHLLAALRNPLVLQLGLIGFLTIGSYIAIALSIPAVLADATGWSAGHVGYLVGLGGLLGVASQLFVGWHSDRTGERFAYLIGSTAIVGTGCLTIGLATTPAVVIPAFLIFATAWSCVSLSTWMVATDILHVRTLAVGSAAINSISQLGAFVAPFAWGLAKDATGDFRTGLAGLSAVFFAAVIAILILRRQIRATGSVAWKMGVAGVEP